MNDSVVIKSNAKGLTLVLDKDLDFADLVRDICVKFAESRNFFGYAEFALTIENRPVTAEEASVIIEAIEINSDIKILLIEEKNVLKDKEMLGKIDKFFYEKIAENAKIVVGNIKQNETVSSDSSILVIGDVKGEVSAAGNIIIFGKLSGKAFAGINSKSASFVVAQSFDLAEVTIGSLSAQFDFSTKGLFKKNTNTDVPRAIVNWQGELVCEPISSGILKQLK